MGLFDQVKNLADVPDGQPFYLRGYEIRVKNTVYGEKEQFILRVAWREDGDTELYSGFSAGILSQLGNSDRRDFPALVKLETTPASPGRSGTRVFVPAQGEQMTISEEDIPF